MRWFAITLLSAMTFGPNIAGAADLPIKAPLLPKLVAPYNWTGLHVGAHGGYGWGSNPITVDWSDPGALGGITAAVAVGLIPVNFSSDMRGGIGGGQIGYDYQLSPNWVVGAEADFSFSGLKASIRSPRWCPRFQRPPW